MDYVAGTWGRKLLDLKVAREAGICGPGVRAGAMAADGMANHRPELFPGRCRPKSRPIQRCPGCIGHEPGVVCRSPAPPSAIFIMRGSGSVVEALAPSGGWPLGVALLCRLDRRRRDDAWRRRDWPLLSSRVPGRGNTPRACVRVSVEFVLEGADLGVDLRKKALEPVWATIAGGACGCPDPDALLRDRGRGHGAVGQEWRDSLRREPIQKVGTLDTKGWEGIGGLRPTTPASQRYA